jgi:hypothetical protein
LIANGSSGTTNLDGLTPDIITKLRTRKDENPVTKVNCCSRARDSGVPSNVKESAKSSDNQIKTLNIKINYISPRLGLLPIQMQIHLYISIHLANPTRGLHLLRLPFIKSKP